MYCRYCGKEIPNDSKFCTECGFSTSYINDTSSHNQKEERHSQKETDNTEYRHSDSTSVASVKQNYVLAQPILQQERVSLQTLVDKINIKWNYLFYSTFCSWIISVFLLFTNWFKIDFILDESNSFTILGLGNEEASYYFEELPAGLAVINIFLFLSLIIIAFASFLAIKNYIAKEDSMSKYSLIVSIVFTSVTMILIIALPKLIKESVPAVGDILNINLTLAPIIIIILNLFSIFAIFLAKCKFEEDKLNEYLEIEESIKGKGSSVFCSKCGTYNEITLKYCKSCCSPLTSSYKSTVMTPIHISKNTSNSISSDYHETQWKPFLIIPIIIWVISIFLMTKPWITLRGISLLFGNKSFGLSIFNMNSLSNFASFGISTTGLKTLTTIYNIVLFLISVLVVILFFIFIKNFSSEPIESASVGITLSIILSSFSFIFTLLIKLLINALVGNYMKDALDVTIYPIFVVVFNIISIFMCYKGKKAIEANELNKKLSVHTIDKHIEVTICPYCGANNKGNRSNHCFSCGESLYKK